MSNMDPIAYTFEADVHCPVCTEKRFGRGPHGFIAEGSTDREGNQVGAVFSWDRDGDWPGNCSDCGGQL